jgi:iron complex outermembrane receptor protein
VDAANRLRIPAVARWDAGVRYATQTFERPLTLRLSVENLFNKAYWMTDPMTNGFGFLALGAPRALALSATVDF